MKSFYKNSDNSWIVNGEVQNRMGDWKLGYHTDNTYAKVTNNGAIVINNPITEIEKDSSGNKYDSYNEFNSSVLDFFVKASGGSGEASWGGVSGNIEDQEDLTNALDSKVDKVVGKQLSDENYTLAEKQKLEGLSSLALGETASTAYRGDRGKEAYDHSQSAHAPSNAQKNSDITKAEIEAKLTGAITSHTHSAYVPTSRTVAGKALTGNITLAKGDVGLGNVDNTSDLLKPISNAVQTALDGKVGNSRVLTDVPANAKFTDTVPITSVNGKTGAVEIDVEDIESLNKLSVILGDEAGKSITTGDWNVMIGNKSGESNTTGGHITAVGNRAGASNLEGSFWTAIGSHAAYSNSTGYGFVAIGVDAGRENISGYGWTAIGANAGTANTTGRTWTAIGSQAGEKNTSGIGWTAIGFDAGKENLTGNAWTAVGNNAGQNALGSFWTAIGTQAGIYNTADESVSIGFKAAENLANGTSQATSFANSVHIGSRVKVSADGVTNEIAIGHNAIGKGSNTVVIGNDDTTKTYLNGEVHASIAASMITESTTKRFVADTEKSTWNAKIDANKFQVVTELPASPDQDTFYFIEE